MLRYIAHMFKHYNKHPRLLVSSSIQRCPQLHQRIQFTSDYSNDRTSPDTSLELDCQDAVQSRALRG